MYLEPHKVLDHCIYVDINAWNGAAITEDGEVYLWGLNIFGPVSYTHLDVYKRQAQRKQGTHDEAGCNTGLDLHRDYGWCEGVVSVTGWNGLQLSLIHI